MKIIAVTVTSTSLLVAVTAAAFTLEHKIGRSPALIPQSKRGFGVQPWVGSNDGVKRSMVAMEPERASGNNEKDFDRVKPNTSILRPEELMKEMKEANDFSEWQGSHVPKEEIHHNGKKSKKDALVDIGIDDMVQEVEEVLDADDDSSKAELIIAEVEPIAEAAVDEKPEVEADYSTTPAAVAAIEAAKKAEDRFKNKQHLSKYNVFFRVLNRVLVSNVFIETIMFTSVDLYANFCWSFFRAQFLEERSKRMSQRPSLRGPGFQELLSR